MADTITHHVSHGIQNQNDLSKLMYWYQTNFNMPVPNYLTPNSPFQRYYGPVWILNETSSYNLSSFSPGFEMCNGLVVVDMENDTPFTRAINTQFYVRWTDASLNTLYWAVNGTTLSAVLQPGYYYEWWYGSNIGVASWEISASGLYHFRSSTTGNPTISPVDTTLTVTNCPSVTQLASNKPGHIWVEGNNLCFVNSNQWKHTIVGTFVSSSPGASKAGYLWVDNSGDIHWVGSSGNDYKIPWKIKQFASFYNNGATGATYAPAGIGKMWVDSEFGGTHLAYIAPDGYKYLAGSGVYPY